MHILDQEGRLAHGFYGLPATAYKAEIAKGLSKLKLPEVLNKERPAVLPDRVQRQGRPRRGLPAVR